MTLDLGVASIVKNYFFILNYDFDTVNRKGKGKSKGKGKDKGEIRDGRGAYIVKGGFVEVLFPPFTTISTVVDYCGEVVDVCKKLK